MVGERSSPWTGQTQKGVHLAIPKNSEIIFAGLELEALHYGIVEISEDLTEVKQEGKMESIHTKVYQDNEDDFREREHKEVKESLLVFIPGKIFIPEI